MSFRFAWGSASLLLWLGCGGAFVTTANSDDDGGTTGGTTTGGSTTGGSTTGGSTTGGSTTGGSTTGGPTTSGAGGSTGTAGSVGTTTGGGTTGGGGSSGGTGGAGGAGGNRGPDWNSCDGPGQCVAMEKSCCGSCGTADVSAYEGVNTKRVQDFRTQLCPNPVVCPAIACVQQIINNIGARCVAGHCQAFDVRKVPEFSACDANNTCQLRAGLGCCTCGGGNAGWAAVSASGEQAITNAECTANSVCPDCLPIPPPKMLASCSNHVCQVLLAP